MSYTTSNNRLPESEDSDNEPNEQNTQQSALWRSQAVTADRRDCGSKSLPAVPCTKVSSTSPLAAFRATLIPPRPISDRAYRRPNGCSVVVHNCGTPGVLRVDWGLHAAPRFARPIALVRDRRARLGSCR